VVGRPEWAETGSPYDSFAHRRENSQALLAELEEIFLERTLDEWLPLLYAASIPCGPINDVAGALKEEHTRARGLVVQTEHPRWGTVEQVASPVRVGNEPPAHRRAPQLNEDFKLVTGTILGLDADQVRGLTAEGAFGPPHPHTDSSDAEAAAR
jgi:crotonobetainyl-CoA:carnitine CoA-transferase CaiB-like acyl-CoA transferase